MVGAPRSRGTGSAVRLCRFEHSRYVLVASGDLPSRKDEAGRIELVANTIAHHVDRRLALHINCPFRGVLCHEQALRTFLRC